MFRKVKDFANWLNLFRRAIEIIVTKYPIRTSLGVLLGCILELIHQILLPALENIQQFDLVGITGWQFVLLGVFILHIPSIFQVFLGKPILDESIERLLATATKSLEKGNFSLEQRRMVYLSIVRRVLDSVELNETTQERIKKIEQQLKELPKN